MKALKDTAKSLKNCWFAYLRLSKKSEASQQHKETARYLKQESGEHARVEARTRELLAREYTAPKKQVPCVSERRACVDCYRLHAEKAAERCRGAVDAYSKCAYSELKDVWTQEMKA